jgi:uncharacterized protein (TIGR03083 family)
VTASVTTFESAARSFAGLVHRIPGDRWDGPGLGAWDLRSLVGHTSRSLVTVSTYLQTAAEREDVATPQEYYARIRDVASNLSGDAIVERGRQSGRDLGDDPAGAVDEHVERVMGELARSENPLIEVIGGLGIRLHTYLPTRTFELAVHGLDIARATGLSFGLPDDVRDEAVVLAARIGVATGDGETVLLALTGRAMLPASFSVV